MKYEFKRVILAKTFDDFLKIENQLFNDGFRFLGIQLNDVIFTRNTCGIVTNIAVCCYWWEVKTDGTTEK